MFFVYGNDIRDAGIYGQPAEARGESNAHHIPVKWRQCRSNSNAYFSDLEFDNVVPLIRQAVKDIIILADKRMIIPFPKIGEGQSRLKQQAPRILQFINSELSLLVPLNLTYHKTWR